jgi:Adenosine deaminase
VVASLRAHPLRQLVDAGLVVTLNSDDPPMFNTTLRDEYLTAVRVLGLSPAELADLVRAAARAAFLPPRAATRCSPRSTPSPSPPEGARKTRPGGSRARSGAAASW